MTNTEIEAILSNVKNWPKSAQEELCESIKQKQHEIELTISREPTANTIVSAIWDFKNKINDVFEIVLEKENGGFNTIYVNGARYDKVTDILYLYTS